MSASTFLPSAPNSGPRGWMVGKSIARDLVGEKSVCYVGASLGGFYATYLVETQGGKAVLINPAIDPHVGLSAYLGTQRNLYTGEAYELTREHLEQWRALYVPRITPERYLLLVETGDERSEE